MLWPEGYIPLFALYNSHYYHYADLSEFVFKIMSVLLIIFHAVSRAVCFKLTNFSCDYFEDMRTLSYLIIISKPDNFSLNSPQSINNMVLYHGYHINHLHLIHMWCLVENFLDITLLNMIMKWNIFDGWGMIFPSHFNYSSKCYWNGVKMRI